MTLEVARVEVLEPSAPLAVPRRNAFGEMRAQPALLVQLTDRDGHEGRGECFANWPAFGAAHRARILREILAPILVATPFDGSEAMWFEASIRPSALVTADAASRR